MISLKERLTYRSSISSLADSIAQLELALKRQQPIPPRLVAHLARYSNTSDPSQQLMFLTSLHSQLETEYLKKLREAAPQSLSHFVEFLTPDEPPAEHHEFFCDKLMALERRDMLRATFSCPPGHAKTKFCSRYFPAWYLGRNLNHRYLQGGHSQNFAENEFGKVVRDIIADPRYREVFPGVRLNPKSTAAGNWRIAGSRGGYVTKGVGQSISGYRGHIGGIDDPFGSREDAQSEAIRNTTGNWLFTDFRTRLLPNSPMFLIATRWHPDDLIGRVEALTKTGTGIPWEIYNLPAIIETEEEMALDPMGRSIGEPLWPDYYTVEELMELKATLPSGDWLALYKGTPRDAEGNLVKAGWFERYDRLPANVYGLNEIGGDVMERRVRRVTVSVDCAEKATARAAFTVATVWIEDMQRRHYLADVRRKKVEYPEMVTMIEDLATQWGAGAILVENAGAGTQYIQQRAGHSPAPIVSIEVSNKSKEFRFDGISTMIEAGEVWLPRRASWLATYEEELLAFPNSTYKDQVDSTSQYLAWARKRGSYGSKRLKGTRHVR